ncbi:MAG: hypothetical protein ABI443_11600 [Chthoniobacterales bacterium]
MNPSGIIRWLFAPVCLYFAVKVFFKLAAGGTALHVLAAALFGFAIMMFGIFLVAPEVVRVIASPISNFFGGIFFLNARYSKPPLSYNLARFYEKEERLDEAIVEYGKIIRYYPEERDAYLELLTTAMHARDMRSYKKYAAKFRRRFKCDVEITWDTSGIDPKYPGFRNGRPINPSRL